MIHMSKILSGLIYFYFDLFELNKTIKILCNSLCHLVVSFVLKIP